MKIEHVKLDALIPYARNSRTHSDAQVAQIAASRCGEVEVDESLFDTVQTATLESNGKPFISLKKAA